MVLMCEFVAFLEDEERREYNVGRIEPMVDGSPRSRIRNLRFWSLEAGYSYVYRYRKRSPCLCSGRTE